jgi:tRNA(Ile)-lysidine synthase
LYQWLREFGFSAWDDIYDLVNSQSGKQIFSSHFRLLKNRTYLILSPLEVMNDEKEFFITKNQKEVKVPLNLSICKVSDISETSIKSIFVDEMKLQFPLVLRRWQEGDSFQPFGMKGKSKKVSKFFKDEKLSLIEKEKAWLLCSNNQIVWIIGMRQDERFAIDSATKEILKITVV